MIKPIFQRMLRENHLTIHGHMGEEFVFGILAVLSTSTTKNNPVVGCPKFVVGWFGGL